MGYFFPPILPALPALRRTFSPAYRTPLPLYGSGLRVARTFAAIWQAWRDGYAETAAQRLGITPAEARERFDDQIATILDETQYAVWQVPVVSARVP
jgi:hypothetical protein